MGRSVVRCVNQTSRKPNIITLKKSKKDKRNKNIYLTKKGLKIEKKIEIKDNTLESLKIISNEENEICMSYEKNKINIEQIMNLFKKDNIKINDISTDDGDLEDVFLRLIES